LHSGVADITVSTTPSPVRGYKVRRGGQGCEFVTAQSVAIDYQEASSRSRKVWEVVFNAARVGVWQSAAAFALLLALVFARAPLRKIPDALFVSDGFGYYLYLPSFVIDHDLDFSNQLGHVPYEASKSYFNEVAKTGLRADPFPVGAAVLWLPFFVLGHAVVIVLRAIGVGVTPSGFGYLYELPTYCGAFFYGVAGLWLIQRLVSEVFSQQVARTAVFTMLLCTPYAYYLWIEPDMSHVSAAFTIALALYLTWRAMRRKDSRLSTWIGVGASLGLVALVRPYNGLVAIATLPAVWFACDGRDAIGRAFTRLAVCATAALVVFLPQVAAVSVLYGSLMFLPPGTGYDEMRWTRPDFLALAVSTFSYFPLLVVSFVGLFPIVKAATRRSGESGPERPADATASEMFLTWVRPASLLALLVVLYITASYPRGSTFGDSFGQRRIVDWAPLMAIGWASCFTLIPDRHRAAAMKALVVFGIVGVVLTGLYTLHLIPEWGMADLIG
jgi:hypothetical protein